MRAVDTGSNDRHLRWRWSKDRWKNKLGIVLYEKTGRVSGMCNHDRTTWTVWT